MEGFYLWYTRNKDKHKEQILVTRWADRVNGEPHERSSHDKPLSRRAFQAVGHTRTQPEPPKQPEQPVVLKPAIVEMPVVQPPAENSHKPVASVEVKSETVVNSLKTRAKVRRLKKQHSSKRVRLPKLQRRPKLKWAIPPAMILLVGFGTYAVINWSKEPVKSNVLSAQTVEEVAAISTDEKPVILYVTDKTKVAQPFLDKAENGDEVRLYYQAKKAVLYRPSTYSVISVGEFTPPPAKVFIRNGTSGNVQISRAETKIKSVPNVSVTSKDRSSSTGYANTLVIDVSGRYPQEVMALATELGANQSAIPKGETAPEADILVIVGAN